MSDSDHPQKPSGGAREAEVTPEYTFPSPFNWNWRDPVTLVELRMRTFCGMIIAKPRWREKIGDDALAAKWRAEMVELDHVTCEKEWKKVNYDDPDYDWDQPRTKKWPREVITDAQLDWTFAYLRWAVSQVDGKTGIHAASVRGVYQSYSLIPPDLKASLQSCVAVLESVPDEQKDWHPGSNGQVLDLVHPSLYCLRIGKTKVLHIGDENCTCSDPLDEFTVDEYMELRTDFEEFDMYRHPRLISQNFQWLPTIFNVSDTGDVSCTGYINNLHPIKHRKLYSAITSILQHFIPMFERVLSDALSPEPPRLLEVDPSCWYDHLDDDEPSYEEDTAKRRKDRRPFVPDAPPFAPPAQNGNVDISLRGRGLRVIVKLANIVLTPANPKYPGGSWHVEGMVNERIVATGLYYYACDNITESRLAFRVQVGTDDESMEMVYIQDDNHGWRHAFGFAGEDALNQPLGHVIAGEDKCIAFPNVYQHRVEPFELADQSKPGHRKILCFFLVDPYRPVASTRMVPPQQREWYEEEMARIPALRALPRELYDMIAGYALEGTITREEAEADRAKFMEERSNFVVQHNRDVFEVQFSLCEH